MKRYFSLPALLVLILLLTSLLGLYLLQDSGHINAKRQVSSAMIPVDKKIYSASRRLAQLADTAEEHTLAREAICLADR